MRIVGGDLGGRVLRAPVGAATRPTSEKVREAIFGILNRLGGPMGDARVLDLFAGSGALGIEALSRGAVHATFVDFGKAPLGVIRGNLRELGLEARATVLGSDAVAAAARLVSPGFDFVFIDPPYASDLGKRASLALPLESLAPEATIIIEHDRRHAPPETLGSLVRIDERRYGDTLVSFYQRGPT